MEPQPGAPPDGRCGTDMGPGSELRNLRDPVDDEGVICEKGSRTAVRKSDD